jgi:hypothetical protein
MEFRRYLDTDVGWTGVWTAKNKGELSFGGALRMRLFLPSFCLLLRPKLLIVNPKTYREDFKKFKAQSSYFHPFIEAHDDLL